MRQEVAPLHRAGSASTACSKVKVGGGETTGSCPPAGSASTACSKVAEGWPKDQGRQSGRFSSPQSDRPSSAHGNRPHGECEPGGLVPASLPSSPPPPVHTGYTKMFHQMVQNNHQFTSRSTHPAPHPFLSTPFEQPSAATPSGQAQAGKPRHHCPDHHADQRRACAHTSVCVMGVGRWERGRM